MPVINTQKLHFERDEFIRKISVDKNGNFSCNLPPAVTALIGTEKCYGKTKNELEAAYERTIKEYESAQTVKRKVILFSIQLGGTICRGDACVFKRDDVSFADGLAIDIAAEVFEECCVRATEGAPRYNYTRLESSIPESLRGRRYDTWSTCGRQLSNQLEWTQERENFFAKLGLAMESIILELDKLETIDKLTAIADSGKFRMIGNT